MAKVSKKKVSKKSKKSVKKSSEAAEETPHVPYDDDDDDDDDEEGLNGAGDANINSEEEEEEDERRRHKLLEAISALGGQRKRPLGERSEAAVQMSEFTVSAEGGGGGVELSDLIGSLDQTPAVPNKTKKQLRNLQRGKALESPLSRQQSERIQRDVAFQKASGEVTRWKSVIQQNQRAEQLVFPLHQEAPGPKTMEKVVTGWKARTPLEQEIFALLSANKQPVNNPVLTPAEEASLRAMSLEDAKIRRAELQKARALQSYYEAKARRERKIKSKKYHRVQNKAKRKEFLKQFDDMVKTDPAAALEELNKMELARMQERMSLKHQNSGKWAKSKAIMAKYDEGARKAMQQQLEVNKELTQKLATSLNDEGKEEEEEAAEEEEAEVLPDFVNDAEGGPDSSNPWMRGKLTEEPEEKEKNDTVEVTAAAAAAEEEEEEEEEEGVVETEEEALLREFDSRRKQRQAQEEAADEEEEEEEVEEMKDGEEEELSEFTNLYKEMTDGRRDAEAEQAEATPDASSQLEEGLVRIRTLEDVDLLSQEADEAPAEPQQPPAPPSPPPVAEKVGKNKKRKRGIELEEVLTKETKVIQVPLAPTIEDLEDQEEKLDQRGLIKEAFAGDDVVSDFLKDKRQQEDAGKPKVVDLTLPGWGEWGGTGLKPSRSKRRRFRVKTAPPPARKDRSLPSVIISEKRNSSISLHQVNSLPVPFQNHTQFEGTIRCPLGRTWNTERTVKKITKPRVVTRMGAIIEPMAREELMKGKKRASAGSNSGVNWKREHY
ncbi:U3 small nucleolar RNA-associated protein 14 homolog A [Thunnus thynnus]|uniref:U3 small nucleolar RNA-associated protein 14 homolog A n=1 Tax=Thunnus thynnus TaxID=8237 RepID=UPI003528E88D